MNQSLKHHDMRKPKESTLTKLTLKHARNNALLTAIANQTGSKRLAAIVDLVTQGILDDPKAVGVIRHRRKIISDTSALTRDQVKAFRSIKNSGKSFYVIPLSDQTNLVVHCTHPITDGGVEVIQNRLSEFVVNKPRLSLIFVIVAILITISVIPVKEGITTKATVLGYSGTQVVAGSTGVLESVAANGEVAKGEVIASLKNNDQLLLDKALVDLANIEMKIISEGSLYTQNLHVLELERQKLALDVKTLEQEVSASQIVAGNDGIINWELNVLGTMIQKSQTIGTIYPARTKTIELNVNAEDWINLEQGDKVLFLNSRTHQSYLGTVSSYSLASHLNNGVEQHRVYAILESELPTGTTGVATIKGQYSVLVIWLFRKQVNSFLSKLQYALS